MPPIGWKKHGGDLARLMALLVPTETGCLVPRGRIEKNGYCKFKLDYRSRLAHRAMWEMVKGPIPDGLQIDHLCKNKSCCNIEHLELVTPKENLARAETGAKKKAARTHCAHGHEFTEENTYWYGTTRQCRICRRVNWNNMSARKRARRNEPKSR